MRSLCWDHYEILHWIPHREGVKKVYEKERINTDNSTKRGKVREGKKKGGGVEVEEEW